MSNKPKTNINSVNNHIQGKMPPKQDQVIAAARAAEAAKEAVAKAPEAVVADKPKESEAKVEESKSTKEKHVFDRKTKDQWKAIIAEMLKDNLDPATVSKRYNVSRGSIYKYKSELSAELAKDSEKAEAAKLTPLSHAENTKKLLESVDEQLEAFDAKVAEAQAVVDGAAAQRKVIEESKADYKLMLDLLAKQEAVANALKAKTEAE